jgi:hypothetical protein
MYLTSEPLLSVWEMVVKAILLNSGAFANTNIKTKAFQIMLKGFLYIV